MQQRLLLIVISDDKMLSHVYFDNLPDGTLVDESYLQAILNVFCAGKNVMLKDILFWGILDPANFLSMSAEAIKATTRLDCTRQVHIALGNFLSKGKTVIPHTVQVWLDYEDEIPSIKFVELFDGEGKSIHMMKKQDVDVYFDGIVDPRQLSEMGLTQMEVNNDYIVYIGRSIDHA